MQLLLSCFLPLFARSAGFFYFSPFFRNLLIPPFVRFGLSLCTTLLLAPLFFSQKEIQSPFLILEIVKEGAIGYLLGFLFSLLLEGAALAGEVVGTMMGLSVTELFSPTSNLPSPLMAKAFALVVGALIFSLDLHHLILRFFYDSFSLTTHLQSPAQLIEATSSIFTQMLKYATLPLFFLGALMAMLAIASKLFPEMPILWMGFPLQLLVGFIAIICSLSAFPRILENSFNVISHFIGRILLPLI